MTNTENVVTGKQYFAFVARDTAIDAAHFVLVRAIPIAAFWLFA